MAPLVNPAAWATSSSVASSMPRSANTLRPACSSRARVSALRRWRTIPMGINDTGEYVCQPQNAFLFASRGAPPKDWGPGPRPNPVPRRHPVTDPAAGTPADRSLQFDRAEGARQTPGTACSFCQQPIAGSYYEINGKVACLSCRGQIMAAWNRGSPARRFAKALGLGAAAAALGAGVYFGVEALTGYEFGLIAVVVGLIVGAAVRKGSSGRGGR